MASRLLIAIATDGALTWLVPATGQRGTGTPAATVVAAAQEIIAIVGAEAILLTTAELPRTSAAKLARIMPFALEDQVLDAVETLHFALGPQLDDGRHVVAVVAKATLEAWLAALTAAGVHPDVLIPDCLALPLPGGHAAAFVDGPRSVVRLTADRGFACAADALSTWLPAEAVAAGVTIYTSANTRNMHPPSGLALAHEPATTLLDLAARGLNTSLTMNLLQGMYTPHQRRAPERQLWRTAAVLAIAALLLAFVGRAIDVARLARASGAADAAIAAIYAKSFPNSPPVPDPVARMQSALQRAGGTTSTAGLMPLLTRVAPVLASQDYRLRVDSLEFRNGTLELAVHAPSLDILDQLRERMTTLPATGAELTAATPNADGVDGRLRITGGAP